MTRVGPTDGHRALLQIQEQREGLADLAEEHRADIAGPLMDPGRGHGAHVLALR